jgi:hypothetical protein
MVRWLTACLILVSIGCGESRPEGALDVAAEWVAPDRSGAEAWGGPALPDLTGTVYRATEFVAYEPTDQLNEAWAAMVANHTLAVLFVVQEHNQQEQRMTIEMTSAWIETELDETGQVEATEYRFGLEPVTITLELDGVDFTIPGTFAIDLFPMSVNKPFHIHGATGYGRLSPGGQGLEELRLAGFLAESQVADFCLNMPGLGDVNLHWFLNLAHICATADSDGDGQGDSYLFKGLVRGVVEADRYRAGVHPIEPLVSECSVHDEACN